MPSSSGQVSEKDLGGMSAKKTVRAIKWVVNILIVMFVVLIFAIIWTGGFDVHLAGIGIGCYNLANPVLFVTLLILIRFALGIGWTNSLTLLAALLLAAVGMEVGLRVLNPPLSRPSLKQIIRPSATLGYELVPNLRGGKITINSQGLRDRERDWEKPKGVRRILGIGDSFTFGYQVALDESYLKQLETKLNRTGGGRSEGKWDVINAGVTGYNMWQYLEYFRCCGYRYNPDLLIIGVFFDDFNGDPYPGAGRDAGSSKPETYRAFSFLRLVNFIRNSSEILKYRYRHLIGVRWLKSIQERRAFIEGTKDGPLLKGTADPQIYRKFETRLDKILQIAKEHHIKVLVMLIPDVIQIGHPELQGVNRILKDMCDRLGVAYLDITPAFERIKDVNSLYLLPYDAHTSPRGHSIIASQLEKRVLELFPQ